MRDRASELAQIQAYIDDHGFLDWLNTTVEDVECGSVTLAVPFRPEFTNHSEARDVAHGGIVMSLFDTACGFALRSTLDDPGEVEMGTTDINVSFLRPATDDLTAEAEVIRAGESVGVVRGMVYSRYQDEEVPVAAARATFHLERG